MSSKVREASLAVDYLYRFGVFALDFRKRKLSGAVSPIILKAKIFDILLPRSWFNVGLLIRGCAVAEGGLAAKIDNFQNLPAAQPVSICASFTRAELRNKFPQRFLDGWGGHGEASPQCKLEEW